MTSGANTTGVIAGLDPAIPLRRADVHISGITGSRRIAPAR